MGLIQADVSDFLLHCEVVKQYSNNTIRNYRQTLRTLTEFFLSKGFIETEDLNALIINEFRKDLSLKQSIRKQSMSPRSQAYFIIILRSLLKFLLKKGRNVINPDTLELPKNRMRKIEYLTENEINRLISVAIGVKSKRISRTQKKRDKAIILTFFGSGLRLSELLSLKKTQLETGFEGQILIEGKGGKVRAVFLAPAALQAISEYLQERGSDENPYIFVTSTLRKSKNNINHENSNNDNWEEKEIKRIKPEKISDKLIKIIPKRSLNPKSVQNLIRKYAMLAGIDKHITPHTLRHSFATKVLNAGGDLRSVQTLLGHSNISTTQIYTHITDTQIKELHKKVFGDMSNSKGSLI
jgi:site-specific recombinase XerD